MATLVLVPAEVGAQARWRFPTGPATSPATTPAAPTMFANTDAICVSDAPALYTGIIEPPVFGDATDNSPFTTDMPAIGGTTSAYIAITATLIGTPK